MTTFAATFRIHEDAGYSDRYSSVVDAIKRCCHGKYWDQTTSFFVFSNPSSSTKITSWIAENSKFSAAKDVLLVINLAGKGHSAIGAVADKLTLDQLLNAR